VTNTLINDEAALGTETNELCGRMRN